MSASLVACLSVGTSQFTLAISDLQASLERWDQERHAQD
jgi:hypothetical protein